MPANCPQGQLLNGRCLTQIWSGGTKICARCTCNFYSAVRKRLKMNVLLDIAGGVTTVITPVWRSPALSIPA